MISWEIFRKMFEWRHIVNLKCMARAETFWEYCKNTPGDDDPLPPLFNPLKVGVAIIETSQFICFENQSIGFCYNVNFSFNGLF